MYYDIIKYPRTPHLEGSKLQEGDEDLSQVPFSEVLNKYIVIEEKIDGANVAISFDDNGKLLLQNRGHYFYGGYKERHYDLFKRWAVNNANELYSVLSNRYIMYGEWMYAKHQIFYDALPDYFIEFDIYDRVNEFFLDTKSRKQLTDKLPIINSVPVLACGIFKSKKEILNYLGNSLYITSNFQNAMYEQMKKTGLEPDFNDNQTMLMEGLYIKVENNGIVTNRVKYVRASYTQLSNEQTESVKWQRRAIIVNQIKKKIDR